MKKVDNNQSEIVRGLRSIGASVQSLAAIGKGAPDLLVGRAGLNYLMEVKDGAKFPSQRRLTAAEKAWHETWRGSVHVVETLEDALRIVGAS